MFSISSMTSATVRQPAFPPAHPDRSKVPFLGAMLLAFATPWDDMITIYGDIQVVRPVTLVVFALWALFALRQNSIRPPRSVHGWMVAFTAWSLLTLFWSINPDRTFRRGLSYLQLICLAWIIYQSSDSLKRYRAILQAALAGELVLIAGVFSSYVQSSIWGDGRYTTADLNPNDLAGTLAIGIPIAWWLLGSGSRWVSILNGLYIPLAISAIVLTGSRTGVLAAGASLLYPSLRLLRLRWRVRIGGLALAALSLILVTEFSGTSPWNRLLTTANQLQEKDLNGRMNTWELGFEVFSSSPWVGIGSGAFSTVSGSISAISMAAHNVFVEIAVELGFVGFMLFMMIIFNLFSSKSQDPELRKMVLGLLFTWFVVSMASSWENKGITWFLFGLVTRCPVSSQSLYSLRWASRRAYRGAMRSLPLHTLTAQRNAP